MNEERITQSPSWRDPRGQVMKTPDELAEMLRLKACGWGLPGLRGIWAAGGGRREAVQVA
jgi:hypothetical protein